MLYCSCTVTCMVSGLVRISMSKYIHADLQILVQDELDLHMLPLLFLDHRNANNLNMVS